MGPDLSIYQNLLRPPKSMADYASEMDAAEQNKLALQGQRMNLLTAQRAEADQQALRQLYQQPDFNPSTDDGIMKLMRVNPQAGYAAQKARLETRKGEADLTKTGVETEKERALTSKATIEAAGEKLKQYRGALDYIDTPEGAARWLQAQFQDPLTAGQMSALGSYEQAVQRIPRDPAAFQQWRQQAAMGMEKHVEAMRRAASDAETKRAHLAGEANTRRGQDMVDDRTRESNDINRSLTNEKKQFEVDALKRQKEGAISAAASQIAVIDKALTHPGRETSTGLSGTLDPRNYTPGTDAADFKAVLDQIGGSAFLQAFESLKGGGQITEVEGKKATDAIARLNRKQSDKEFKQSLNDLRDVMTTGYKRLSGADYGGGASAGGGLSPAEQAELETLRKQLRR